MSRLVQGFLPSSAGDNDFLKYLWSNHDINSPCATCGRAIDPDDAPFRTVSLTAPSTAQEPQWRVHNRHFDCVHDTAYTAFSHVWHPSIAKAHIERKRLTVATRAVRATISAALRAVSATWGHKTEIWHDYVSVPQWCRPVQQQLLLRLPDIYAGAQRTIVHLDDVKNRSIDLLFSKESKDRLHGIRDVLAAQWFERMWVCLEWARSNRVHPLTEEGVIRVDTDDLFWGMIEQVWAEELQVLGFEQLTFRYPRHLETGKAALRNPPGQEAGSQAFNIRTPYSVSGSLEVRGKTDICFGQAVSVIAERYCREWRDRYVAMLSFTGVGLDGNELPPDSIDACLALALKCLARGDHSPLLLSPGRGAEKTLDRRVRGSMSPYPSWLRGYAYMDYLTFPFGSQMSPADETPTVLPASNGKPPQVILNLEPGGVIESSVHYDFNHEDMLSFGLLVRQALSLTRPPTSQEELCTTVITNLSTRCYGVPPAAATAAFLEDDQAAATFHTLLDYFASTPPPPLFPPMSWSLKHLDIAWFSTKMETEHAKATELARLMGLGTTALQRATTFEQSPLHHAQYRGAALHKWSGRRAGSEVVIARCEGCGQRSLYRFAGPLSRVLAAGGGERGEWAAKARRAVERAGEVYTDWSSGKLYQAIQRPWVRSRSEPGGSPGSSFSSAVKSGKVQVMIGERARTAAQMTWRRDEGDGDLVGARIGRITGLRYSNAGLVDAVGLAVKNGRVLGRMVYGVRGCQCLTGRLEKVELV